jgi:hypothetical protein
MSHPITELTSLSVQTRAESKGPLLHFQDKTADGAPIVVKDNPQGPYRPKLVSVYLSNKHICNMKVEPPYDHQLAKEVMTIIARDLIAGVIDKKNVYKYRDEILAKMNMPRPGIRKRPAAAEEKPRRRVTFAADALPSGCTEHAADGPKHGVVAEPDAAEELGNDTNDKPLEPSDCGEFQIASPVELPSPEIGIDELSFF